MNAIFYGITGIMLVLCSGCADYYVGSSRNVNGNPCDSYEQKTGIQFTSCDLGNENLPLPR